MKTNNLIQLIWIFCILSCGEVPQKDKKDIIVEFVNAQNKNDTAVIRAMISEKLKDIRLLKMDSTINILDYSLTHEIDSIVIESEGTYKLYTRMEPPAYYPSSMGIFIPKSIKTIRFNKENKIDSIGILDQIHLIEDSLQEFTNSLYAFQTFYNIKYPDVKNNVQHIKTALKEFGDMNFEEKEALFALGFIKGRKFYCVDNCIYKSFEFKGNSTCVTTDAIFGFQFAGSYVIDQNYVRIKTDKSDLLLKFKDGILLGEGWSDGTYYPDWKDL